MLRIIHFFNNEFLHLQGSKPFLDNKPACHVCTFFFLFAVAMSMRGVTQKVCLPLLYFFCWIYFKHCHVCWRNWSYIFVQWCYGNCSLWFYKTKTEGQWETNLFSPLIFSSCRTTTNYSFVPAPAHPTFAARSLNTSIFFCFLYNNWNLEIIYVSIRLNILISNPKLATLYFY